MNSWAIDRAEKCLDTLGEHMSTKSSEAAIQFAVCFRAGAAIVGFAVDDVMSEPLLIADRSIRLIAPKARGSKYVCR